MRMFKLPMNGELSAFAISRSANLHISRGDVSPNAKKPLLNIEILRYRDTSRSPAASACPRKSSEKNSATLGARQGQISFSILARDVCENVPHAADPNQIQQQKPRRLPGMPMPP